MLKLGVQVFRRAFDNKFNDDLESEATILGRAGR